MVREVMGIKKKKHPISNILTKICQTIFYTNPTFSQFRLTIFGLIRLKEICMKPCKYVHLKATGGVWGQKNMLILFERFHRCGVNAFYGMSKFYSVQKLLAFQCVGPFTFL